MTFMHVPLQPKLTESISRPSFDPHLLLQLSFLQPDALAAIVANPDNNDVRFIYNGKACKFGCYILNCNRPLDNTCLQMAIELINPSLHYGQFMTDKNIELAINGQTVARGIIAEVLDPNFLYWDASQLPDPLKNKKPVVNKETLKTFLLNLEFDLIALNFIEDYHLEVITEAHNFINLELSVPNKTLTLIQAQKLERIFKEQCFGESYYKADYAPFSYGLLDILMQNYTAAFAIANKKNYITGTVKAV